MRKIIVFLLAFMVPAFGLQAAVKKTTKPKPKQAAAKPAAMTAVQNDSQILFYAGTEKTAEWTWNPDGTVEAKGATVNGEVKVYSGKAEKQMLTTYKIRENTVEDGIYIWKYKSGESAGQETFNNGKRHGPYRFLHKNGKISKEGTYSEGKKQGLFTLYYENGKQAEETNYKNGLREGESALYFPTGEAKESYTYVEDRKHGPYQEFYKSGTIKTEGNYKLNLKDGPFAKFFVITPYLLS